MAASASPLFLSSASVQKSVSYPFVFDQNLDIQRFSAHIGGMKVG